MCRLPSCEKQAQATTKITAATTAALIVFDWDDTLLPTTALAVLGHDLESGDIEVGSAVDKDLRDHSAEVLALLKEASKYGQVMIITAAERGWVELTCAKFMPTVHPAVCGPDAWIQVVSARSEYETPTVTTSFEWKLLAFREALKHHRSAGGTARVVSVGDADRSPGTGVREREPEADRRAKL
mmetsp:Transcript_115855/g.266009  ORF Transcript_115855/g.266009 Transcript_115855/m.266009 type:complete len:184 (-) Transcript_115855:305-856(-)